MKPFNLKEALEGKSVVTRNGRKITQIAYFPKAHRPVLFQIEDAGTVFGATETGKNAYYDDEESIYDLFMASTKINVEIGIFQRVINPAKPFYFSKILRMTGKENAPPSMPCNILKATHIIEIEE